MSSCQREGRRLCQSARRHVWTSWRFFIPLVKLLALPLGLGCCVEQTASWLVASFNSLLFELDAGPLIESVVIPEEQQAVHPPLKTRGKQLLDSRGNAVRLRCVNWYGAHLPNMVVGGLHKQSLQSLVRSINVLGFNCIRLPYSLEMHLDRPNDRPPSEAVRANPSFQNMSVLSILDATIEALAAAHIVVILNNHQGKARWCCSEDDGEGLWFTQEYSEDDWVRSLRMMARRYRSEKYVAGYDLRNEPRGIPAQSGPLAQGYLRPHWSKAEGGANWAAAALRAGIVVAEEDPDALVIVEGLDFATDLRGVADFPLHEHPALQGRVMYEAHDYCWYHSQFFHGWQLYWLALGWLLHAAFTLRSKESPALELPALGQGKAPAKLLFLLSLAAACVSQWMTSYSVYEAKLNARWGYLMHTNAAPVWLGEFGTNGYWVSDVWWMEVGEVLWLQHLLRYTRANDLSYAYWALNGDKEGQEETFGLLQQDYVSLRYPWLMRFLP